MAAEATIQGALSRMAEGWMADVVDQSEGLGQILVQAECTGGHASDLCNLDCVRKAAAKVIGRAAGEDLRLSGETAKGARLDDAFPVALKGGTRGAIGRGEDSCYKRIVRVSCNRASMKIDGHSQL
jgi:hypothetical protein